MSKLGGLADHPRQAVRDACPDRIHRPGLGHPVRRNRVESEGRLMECFQGVFEELGFRHSPPPAQGVPRASLSIEMASWRVPSAAESPRSMAAISSIRWSSSSGVMVVWVRPGRSVLRMIHW